MYKVILRTGVFASCFFASTALAFDHDETFPRMMEMVSSASPEELENIKENFCKGVLAATMTAQNIRGRAAELATEEFSQQEIFDRTGVISVQFSTIYADICK